MASKFNIKTYDFDKDAIENLASFDEKERNWPVVYQIYNNKDIYIGETTSLKTRMHQHYESPDKCGLRGGMVKVIFDDTFNKSAALDLESYLIQYFSGDNRYNVINRNDGLLDRDYYNRDEYRKLFEEIWENLRKLKIATKSIAEINNSEIFKFSPYKNLNFEQLKVISDVLLNLDEAFANNDKSLSIIGGSAGTGKTIVIMYLAKLLADLQNFNATIDDMDDESNFAPFFEQEKINQRFKNRKIALVVPQESLKKRIASIFNKSGMRNADVQVFSPIQFADSPDFFDITLIDEAHLLKIGIAHASLNGRVKKINKRLFGEEKGFTELDWIMAKSKNVVMVYSKEQRVRQINLLEQDILKHTEFVLRRYDLSRQMRSLGGESYVNYINNIFSKSFHPASKEVFSNFDAKLFAKFSDMVTSIGRREKEFGLSRLVAGFAWEWSTNKGKSDFDIAIDGLKLRWNKPGTMPTSEEATKVVGSIYTIQGEDLNYVGLIIGPDLYYDKGRIKFNPKHYFDNGAKNRNAYQIDNNIALDDDELLEQVLRIYKVLLTRAIKGVYIYVCDDKLRKYLEKYFDLVYAPI